MLSKFMENFTNEVYGKPFELLDFHRKSFTMENNEMKL